MDHQLFQPSDLIQVNSVGVILPAKDRANQGLRFGTRMDQQRKCHVIFLHVCIMVSVGQQFWVPGKFNVLELWIRKRHEKKYLDPVVQKAWEPDPFFFEHYHFGLPSDRCLTHGVLSAGHHSNQNFSLDVYVFETCILENASIYINCTYVNIYIYISIQEIKLYGKIYTYTFPK